MRFSVINPAHNNSDTISETLESIRGQEHPATEAIVVDDASDDDSAAVAEATGIPDRIVVVDCRNAAAGRNTGIAEVTCEWIAFLDADNLWMRDHLAIARDSLEAGGDGVFCASPLAPDQGVGQGAAVLRLEHPLAHAQTGLTRETFIDWRLKYGWGFPTTGNVISRAVAERIGGFDTTQLKRHDFELVMRAICQTTWCATPLGTWWSRPTRPGDISSDQAECALYAFRALQLNESRYPGRAYRKLMARAAYHAISTAQRHGDPEQVARALSIARRYLGPGERLKVLLNRLRWRYDGTAVPWRRSDPG